MTHAWIKKNPHALKFRTHGEDHSGWSIRFGVSQFLVAYGAGATTPIGRKLFNDLKWKNKRPVRR